MIYAIQVTEKMVFGVKLSDEAYNSYGKAVDYCETRSDNPVKISDYLYESEDYKYAIIPLLLK